MYVCGKWTVKTLKFYEGYIRCVENLFHKNINIEMWNSI